MTAEHPLKRDKIAQLRGESLTCEFLQHMVSSVSFADAMSEMANRVTKTYAEGGFVVYKSILDNSFVISKKYGLPSSREAPELFGSSFGVTAKVDLSDSSTDLKSLGIDPKSLSHVRIGELHFHPASRPLFSQQDIEDYERKHFSKHDVRDVMVARESFDAVATVDRNHAELEVMAISLPKGGLISNVYQAHNLNRLAEQDDILRRSGFRVIRARTPLKSGKVNITPEFVASFIEIAET